MKNLVVNTVIEGRPFEWQVKGDFAWGSGGSLFDAGHDKLHESLGEDGYFIAALPDGMVEFARDAIVGFLEDFNLTPQNYCSRVDETLHQKIISKSRDLRLKNLGWDGDAVCRKMSAVCGVKLSSKIEELGRDHVQVRINRPSSTDFNPPHRDGALAFFRNTINLWIPIFGCTDKSRLPLVPASHLVAESDSYQTAEGGAKINGKSYRVPAIIKTRAGDLHMIRPPVEFGEALIFTPFLMHGLAANFTSDLRISLELRFGVCGQNYAAAV